MEFKDLVKKMIRYNKNSDIELIEKAYNFSKNLLNDKKRISGSPWINHYLSVASEVTELRLDDKTIAASLMHGIINKGASIKDIKKYFGEEIYDILENIEKMSEIKRNVLQKTNESESLRKVLLAASKDIRALLIKICDKVANLRELEYLPASERRRIAKESLEIYAPIAYRLGMGKIKTEIEDLSFKYIDFNKYKELEAKVNSTIKYGEKRIFKIKKIIENALHEEKIQANVHTRVKHIYGVYKKIVDRSYNLDDMSDIIGIRIIVNNLDDCYRVIKIIHSNFRPIPNKFKDYIAMPKPNGYQSLHTSVMNDEGKVFEVQIRTQEMHDLAEEGIASHFSYKKLNYKYDFDKKLNWLKQIVSDKTSMSNFDMNIFGEKVYVFTPKGKVFEIPNGSSVIDFAYQVHSDIGDHCIGANINGKFVSLKEKLENGDIVQILTSKTQKPSREWLKFTKTLKARTKIKHLLKETGRISTANYTNLQELKKEIGENLLIFDGDKNIKTKLALCCKPIPGDNIIGIKTSSVRLMIHKSHCKEISKTGKKKIKASWMKEFKNPIKIIIDAKDRTGLFKEILYNTNKISEATDSKVRVVNKDDAEFSFMVDIGNLKKLQTLIENIEKIKNVKKVYIRI